MRAFTHPLVALLCLCTVEVRAVLQVDIWFQGNPTCGNNTGYAIAQPSGGVYPYTYLWNNNATTDTITGLAPGFYEVTVTDALSATATTSVTLVNDPAPYLSYQTSSAGLHGCGVGCNSGIRWLPQYAPLNLVQPFTFNVPPVSGWNINFPQEEAWLGLCGGVDFTVVATDANGCVATLYDYVYENSEPTPMSVLAVNGACTGASSGSVTVDVGLDVTSAFGPLWQSSILDGAMQPTAFYLSAVPITGQNIGTVSWMPPGDYFLQRLFYHDVDPCVDLLPFTIPDLGANCGNLGGRSWYDLDTDCTYDFNEVGIPNSVFEILPGPEYVITDVNGNYSRDLANGNYTITQLDATLVPGCGISEPWPFTINSNAITVNWVNTSTEPLDLEVLASAGAARPGFDQTVHGAVRNISPQLSGPVTLTCTFDALLTYVSAIPTPTSVVAT